MDTIAENQPPVKQSELPTPTTGPNMDILAELDHLADLRDQQALLDLKRNELRDVVLAPIAQQLADIDAELAPAFDAISTALHDAEMKVKAFTLDAGSSIKGTRLIPSTPRAELAGIRSVWTVTPWHIPRLPPVGR